MPSSNVNSTVKNPWDELLQFNTEAEEREHNAQLLMYAFLAEVQKHQEAQDITRKALAEKIGTSASYITQLFRGNKPLNFDTLAKMQQALDIRFQVKASSIAKKNVSSPERVKTRK